MFSIDTTAVYAALGYTRPPAPTLIVMMPPGSGERPHTARTLAVERLIDALDIPAATVCPGHLYAPATLSPLARRLLIQPQPLSAGMLGCAGGPIGLLDFTATAATIADLATTHHQLWTQLVAGTPPADTLPDLLATEPTTTAAVDRFLAQPLIARMRATNAFGTDSFGAALAAMQAGPGTYTDYLIDATLLGDGLLDTDDTLLLPTLIPSDPITHSLSQRQAYHRIARNQLSQAHPATVIVACHPHT